MKKDVCILVRGLQSDEADYNTTEIMASGEYFLRGGKHYLLYTEYDEEAKTEEKVMLKIAEDGTWMEMTRLGQATAKMMLEQNAVHECAYQTPFGLIHLTITTSRVELKMGETRLEVEAEYRLESDGVFISDNRIRVEATEVRG